MVNVAQNVAEGERLMARGLRTLYQKSGQMAAIDEDTCWAVRDWVDERRHWLTKFELESALNIVDLILETGRRVAKETP